MHKKRKSLISVSNRRPYNLIEKPTCKRTQTHAPNGCFAPSTGADNYFILYLFFSLSSLSLSFLCYFCITLLYFIHPRYGRGGQPQGPAVGHLKVNIHHISINPHARLASELNNRMHRCETL